MMYQILSLAEEPGNDFGYFQEAGDLKAFLDAKVSQYNRPEFISRDPISIPHRFTGQQDREIMGLWTAVLSWGWRPTILKKSMELIEIMGHSPYRFIMDHQPIDLAAFTNFRHRTFNGTDALCFVDFFRRWYENHDSLEQAFLTPAGDFQVKESLDIFHKHFFEALHEPRTKKHISRPKSGSTCKRLNMFLRWMVRSDGMGVDFGIWDKIPAAQLAIPLDLHVDRVSRKLGLIRQKQCNWSTVEELTARLSEFDPADPVKYDFALFSLGIEEKF